MPSCQDHALGRHLVMTTQQHTDAALALNPWYVYQGTKTSCNIANAPGDETEFGI